MTQIDSAVPMVLVRSGSTLPDKTHLSICVAPFLPRGFNRLLDLEEDIIVPLTLLDSKLPHRDLAFSVGAHLPVSILIKEDRTWYTIHIERCVREHHDFSCFASVML